MIKAIFMDYSGVVCQHGSLFEPMLEFSPNIQTKEKSKELYNLAKISKISNEEYYNGYSNEGWEWYFSQTTLHEGIMNFLNENKLPLYIASNHVSKIINKELDILNVREYFKEVFISDQLKLAKPSKEFFLEILKRVGLKAEDIVFVDDQKRNLVPAKEMGMKTIWINNTKIDPFGDNGDVIPDGETYDLSKINEIIMELDK